MFSPYFWAITFFWWAYVKGEHRFYRPSSRSWVVFSMPRFTNKKKETKREEEKKTTETGPRRLSRFLLMLFLKTKQNKKTAAVSRLVQILQGPFRFDAHQQGVAHQDAGRHPLEALAENHLPAKHPKNTPLALQTKRRGLVFAGPPKKHKTNTNLKNSGSAFVQPPPPKKERK